MNRRHRRPDPARQRDAARPWGGAPDVLAGILLLNALPHAVMGVAGQRCLTPLRGEDSSPRVNLLWSAMNLGAGAALLASSGWKAIDRPTAARRLVSLEIGMFSMTSFGMLYELTAGRRKRHAEKSTGPH